MLNAFKAELKYAEEKRPKYNQILSVKQNKYIYIRFDKSYPRKPYATMPKAILGNGGSWSFIEALGVSATWRERAQTNEFMPYRFLLANTVILNQ